MNKFIADIYYQMVKFFEQVYQVVTRIPPGRVMTYGQVAARIGSKDARRVGHALHANRDPQVPCHRVVFADGTLAPGYAFGGVSEQRERLLAEGIKFDNTGKVIFVQPVAQVDGLS